MCNTAEHAFKEKSAQLLILLPLITIYFYSFQCETPCTYQKYERLKILIFEVIFQRWKWVETFHIIFFEEY